ncbi:MAG TPA: winged helix-turn-helix domain-containing protein [Burkholderiaceae bacterium]|nr:winged helix-turn-helix domain-containing protein [Burkholderiaceae bacterium]
MTRASEAAPEAPEAPARTPLQVGEWHVAPDLNRIARGDRVVVLEPKAMALLVVLATRSGEVVSRDALMLAVWPGVVVGDNALTQVVIKLRKALGDTAREPAYVQAIAKKGYRLIAPVRRADEAIGEGLSASPQPIDPPAPSQSVQTPAPRRVSRWLLAGSVVAVCIAVLAGYVSTARAPAPAAMQNDLDSAASPPTIAVHPFEEIDPQPGATPMARAISADLMTDLSNVTNIRVIDASREVAGGGVTRQPRYVLTGTVQREGNRLRLDVLLAESATGRLVWSERFDRHVTDLFSVQDELVNDILKVLPVHVSEAETRRIANRSTRNLEAWEQFVRAQAALLVRRPEQNERARFLYRDAIRLDPAFSRAYAGLAMTYALEAQQGWVGDAEGALARAFELAQTAVKMNPDLPEAHWVLAFVHTQRRQHDEALRDLDDSLLLNPSYADAYALKAGIYTYLGRPSESVALLRIAQRLNPAAGSLYFLLLGRAYYFLGDGEQARLNLGQALERNAQSLEARVYLAASLWQTGDRDEAHWQANEILALAPGFRADVWLATYPLTDPGERRRLRGALAEIGLPVR